MRTITPQCPKLLPGNEFTEDYQLHGLFVTNISIGVQKNNCAWYSRESRLQCVIIKGESGLPGVFGTTKWFCKPILVDSPVYLSPAILYSQVMNTPESHNSIMVNILGTFYSLVVNTPGSRLRVRITPQIFSKNQNNFVASLLRPGEALWWKKRRRKTRRSRDIVPLIWIGTKMYSCSA
jgi:hypothetical protein